MITRQDVRNAKFEEIFFATIERALEWKEAEGYNEPIDKLGMNIAEALRYSAKIKLKEEGKVLSEKNIRKTIEEIEKDSQFVVVKVSPTIVLKKDKQYFDLLNNENVASKYKICNLIPLSKYGAEKDFKIIEEKDGDWTLYFEEDTMEKYLNDIE